MNDELTIVMYHYVREIENSGYPGIKGLEFSGFKRQLDHLSENFNIIRAEDLICSVTEGAPLPERACLLTFDDGYKDHISYVMPELLSRGLQGSFFPPVKTITERRILDVNKIHFILETTQDMEKLCNELDELCLERGYTAGQLETYRKEYGRPARYDPAEVIYVKRMLQHVLPHDVREQIASILFEKHVCREEHEFAEDLYLSLDDAKEMVANQMYVGSHGDEHVWFNTLSPEVQEREIDRSLNMLDSIGARTSDWIMCYPYGGYNEDTLEILGNKNCAVGLTTKVGKAKVFPGSSLELSRFDTNDFPR